jgi:pimeloyl-ACP methyl ester carboxylesterase
VLKATRVDTIHGLVGLMDAAALAVPRLDVPLLVLLGEREEVLPPESVDLMLRRLPPTGRHTVASYPDGYHMLLRDLRGDIVLADIAAWVTDPGAPLPSGNDRRGRTRQVHTAVR